jgi:hypothetical protein
VGTWQVHGEKQPRTRREQDDRGKAELALAKGHCWQAKERCRHFSAHSQTYSDMYCNCIGTHENLGGAQPLKAYMQLFLIVAYFLQCVLLIL